MSGVVYTIDKNLYIVENDGGGDCLLYSFLDAILYKNTEYTGYIENRVKYANVFRKKLLKYVESRTDISKSDMKDLVTDLKTPHASLYTSTIPYIAQFCGCSVILISSVRTQFDVQNTVYFIHNPPSNKYIVILYKNNHFRAVVMKKIDKFQTIFPSDETKIFKKWVDKNIPESGGRSESISEATLFSRRLVSLIRRRK